MAAFRELDTVALSRDLPEHTLRRGDLGAVVHVLAPDLYEVEFVRASGVTEALVSLSGNDLRAVGDADLLSVRPATPRTRGAA
jgi:hypothetical protein